MIGDRIDEVLADLGAQLEAAEAAELAAEVADRTRREAALLHAADRLRASLGETVTVLTAAGSVAGTLGDAGPDWMLLRVAATRSAVLPLAAVVAVAGLRSSALTDSAVGPVASRWGLRQVLRGLARDRRPVRVLARDGRSYAGLLDRCGADFVELTGHPVGSAGRRWLLPLGAIETVYLD